MSRKVVPTSLAKGNLGLRGGVLEKEIMSSRANSLLYLTLVSSASDGIHMSMVALQCFSRTSRARSCCITFLLRYFSEARAGPAF